MISSRIEHIEKDVAKILKSKKISELGEVHIIRTLEDGQEYCINCKGKCKIADNDNEILKIKIKARSPLEANE